MASNTNDETEKRSGSMSEATMTEQDYLVKIDMMMVPRYSSNSIYSVCSELKSFMKKMPEEYKTTKVWERVVIKCGLLLQMVPSEKITEKMCDIAVSVNACAFVYVPEHMKTIKMCLAAVSLETHGFDMMSLVPDHLKKEVNVGIISKHHQDCLPMVQYVPENVLCEVCVSIIEKNNGNDLSKKYVHGGCRKTQNQYYKNNHYETYREHLSDRKDEPYYPHFICDNDDDNDDDDYLSDTL